MQTEEITIRVDRESARAYRAASEQDRLKLYSTRASMTQK